MTTTTLPLTPWRVHENADANQWYIADANGKWVLGTILNGEMLLEQQKAVMDRIVTCVNSYDLTLSALRLLQADPNSPGAHRRALDAMKLATCHG